MLASYTFLREIMATSIMKRHCNISLFDGTYRNDEEMSCQVNNFYIVSTLHQSKRDIYSVQAERGRPGANEFLAVWKFQATV